MNSIDIVVMVTKAFQGIFGWIKRRRALNAAERYLSEKYGLTVRQVAYPSASAPHLLNVYDVKWEQCLAQVARRILRADSVSMALAIDCGDFVLLVAVLSERGWHPWAEVGHDAPNYHYLKHMFNSPTYRSIEHMSRGLGGEVALQFIRSELGAWVAAVRLA